MNALDRKGLASKELIYPPKDANDIQQCLHVHHGRKRPFSNSLEQYRAYHLQKPACLPLDGGHPTHIGGNGRGFLILTRMNAQKGSELIPKFNVSCFAYPELGARLKWKCP